MNTPPDNCPHCGSGLKETTETQIFYACNSICDRRGLYWVRKATCYERELAALRADNERLQLIADQHKKLCLAELGGPDVWPCGCHSRIIDSYGCRENLTAKDGPEHAECEEHARLRAKLAAFCVGKEEA